MDERRAIKQARLDRPPREATEQAELRGLAEVTMVQAADLGKLHDLPCREGFDRPQVGRVLVEGEVGPHLMVVTDVRKGDDCQHMAQKTIEAFGHVDILCANAGTFLDDMRPAWELPGADWDVIFDVNLKGAC